MIYLTKVENALKLRRGSQAHVRTRLGFCKVRWPQKKDRVTIAIGTVYSGGVILCADSKAVASDGATTSDKKISRVFSGPNGRVVIADAAEDANAAKMLGEDIRAAAYNVASSTNPASAIKKVMTEWYQSYHTVPPHLQFLVARVTPPYERLDNGRIYLCEPPATVLESWDTIPIGRGSRAVEPLVDLMRGPWTQESHLKACIVRLAFLMHRAKKDEGSACGGYTDMVILSNKGTTATLTRNEMVQPEQLASWMDHLMLRVGESATSMIGSVNQQSFLSNFSREYLELTEAIEKLKFPSLEWLNDEKSPG